MNRKICLLVEHGSKEMPHSLYMIDLPSDLERQREVDSEGFEALSPLVVFPQRKFLYHSEFVNLGSKVYFFGGVRSGLINPDKLDEDLLRAVHVLDMDNPKQGLLRVASLNACKESPCVFVADGVIYALGMAKGKETSGKSGSGCFERYIARTDRWEVLPDPPLPWFELAEAPWTRQATVVGREVFIGFDGRYVIFNLDMLEWAEPPPASLADSFPYGALYVNGFLYHLRGGVWRPGAVWDPCYFCWPLQIVRRGPFPKHDGFGSSSKDILESVSLQPERAQVVCTAAELAGEDNTFFTHTDFDPWRLLLHLGGGLLLLSCHCPKYKLEMPNG